MTIVVIGKHEIPSYMVISFDRDHKPFHAYVTCLVGL